ncbi:carboxyl-terminal protease [Synechococcales cyanobacterium C]|uniref:Carboxyl-terminal-processing protease n=1 Tax=Petrachloros mirabilis ULC683 TaxID=2781853 RepID=A0A8K2A2H5_9CYAN|nr:carboxyl-terminal processing protease CtpA [Petrachloros mirabilis]NCJ08668.1 carboxyl-terminal protease [Petrachloros mirabilis ULC683]
MGKTLKRWMAVLLLGVFLLSLEAGWAPVALGLTSEQQVFNEAWRIVNQAFVDDSFNHQNWWLVRQKTLKQPLPDREAAYAAIQSMLASLDDPFTRFLQPAQYRSLQSTTAGELSGVGLQIGQDPQTQKLEVIAPIEGSPAAGAGLKAHDQIWEIDRQSTTTLSLDEAAERMRGPMGSMVELTIHPADAVNDTDVKQVTLRRDRIEVNPVYSDLRPQPDGSQIGYIRLRQFNANATRQMQTAIQTLESQGATAYILDLRNNPGGLLQAGVDIAQQWLDPSPIVYTLDRLGTLNEFVANRSALTHAPLAVLINQGTASASEILAGALQDNGRAHLIGERTFGKGSIQSLFDLSDGSGLAVTIAKYETPLHKDINKIGIEPDQAVPLKSLGVDQLGTAADSQYQAAVDFLLTPAVIAGAP